MIETYICTLGIVLIVASREVDESFWSGVVLGMGAYLVARTVT